MNRHEQQPLPPATSTARSQATAGLDELLAQLDSYPIPQDGFVATLRAVAWGVAVVVGGSLVMSTVIGLSAITGMLWRGHTAEDIIATLPQSLPLVLFSVAGALVMSVAGGYVAATKAGHSHVRYAMLAGAFATLLNLALMTLLGDSGPAWLTILTTLLTVPCAALGGWLAAPVPATTVA